MFQNTNDNVPVTTDSAIASTPTLAIGSYGLLGKARFHNNDATDAATIDCRFESSAPVAGSNAKTVVAPGEDGSLALIAPLTVGTAEAFDLKCTATSPGTLDVTAFDATLLAIEASSITP